MNALPSAARKVIAFAASAAALFAAALFAAALFANPAAIDDPRTVAAAPK